MKITKDEAYEFTVVFREAAKAIGDYLYGNWNDIPPSDRDRLRSMHVSLVMIATDLITHAVGIIIDETIVSLDELRGAATQAKTAVANVKDAKKAISIAAALISIGAAIPTGNMGAIASAAKGLFDTIA
jgi:hypothetical protein